MPDPDRFEDDMVGRQPRSRTVLAWSLWLVTFGSCAAGLVVELASVNFPGRQPTNDEGWALVWGAIKASVRASNP